MQRKGCAIGAQELYFCDRGKQTINGESPYVLVGAIVAYASLTVKTKTIGFKIEVTLKIRATYVTRGNALKIDSDCETGNRKKE